MTSLQDLILVIPGLLSKDDCKTIIDCYNDISKNAIYESSYNTKTETLAKSTMKVKEVESSMQEYNLIVNKMETALKVWTNHLDQFSSFAVSLLKERLSYPHKVRILKYDTGDSIHPHVDFRDFHYASCTLNLNDDYTGGEFSFFNQKYDIKLGPGDALVFPNNFFYVHEVKPILSGSRYSVNSFITSVSPKRIAAIEQMWVYNPFSVTNKPFNV